MMQGVDTRQLTSINGFVIVDLPDADVSVGPARLGEKLIPSNANDYVRDITYGFGLLGERAGGLTLGLKVEPDERDTAIAAAATEFADELAAGRYRFDAGLRVPTSALAGLASGDPRPASRLESHGDHPLGDYLEALGAIASAERLLGDLDGKRLSIEGGDATAAAIAQLASERGATIVRAAFGGVCVEGQLDAGALVAALAANNTDALAGLGSSAKPWVIWRGDVDAVIAGSAVGALKDAGAASLGATPVVAYGTAPIVTKALATSMKNGGKVVPSFLTSIGRRVADTAPSEATSAELIAATNDKLAAALDVAFASERGPFVGACVAAESFIESWTARPFGRPLA